MQPFAARPLWEWSSLVVHPPACLLVVWDGHRLSRERSGMSGELRVTREGFGIELRRGRFEVFVDDQHVGSIARHDSFELSLDPGRHSVLIRAGRYSSRRESFEVVEGAVTNFRCHGAMAWPRWLASFVKPDLAISLRRE